MNFHIALFYHAGDGDPSGNAPPLGVGSFTLIIIGVVAQISLWFMGLGLVSTSSLQVGHVSVSVVGLVFRLNTINDNNYPINDT
jgi:hypothetical protein